MSEAAMAMTTGSRFAKFADVNSVRGKCAGEGCHEDAEATGYCDVDERTLVLRFVGFLQLLGVRPEAQAAQWYREQVGGAITGHQANLLRLLVLAECNPILATNGRLKNEVASVLSSDPLSGLLMLRDFCDPRVADGSANRKRRARLMNSLPRVRRDESTGRVVCSSSRMCWREALGWVAIAVLGVALGAGIALWAWS